MNAHDGSPADDASDPPKRRPLGRPRTTLPPTPEAVQLLCQRQEEAGLSNPQLGQRVGMSARTVGRWRAGEQGMEPATADQVATVLDEPRLRTLWTSPPPGTETAEHDGVPAAVWPQLSQPPTAESYTSSTSRPPAEVRRWWLLAGAIGAVVLLAVTLGIISWLDRGPGRTSNLSAGPTLATDDLPTDTTATFIVDAALTGGTMATGISSWTKPSTTTGCDASPCLSGTLPSGEVRGGQRVAVSCVSTGQLIRNGAPGADGYAEDNRWLLLAASEDVGQAPGERVWLSNLWLARDDLPSTVPVCPTPD